MMDFIDYVIRTLVEAALLLWAGWIIYSVKSNY